MFLATKAELPREMGVTTSFKKKYLLPYHKLMFHFEAEYFQLESILEIQAISIRKFSWNMKLLESQFPLHFWS